MAARTKRLKKIIQALLISAGSLVIALSLWFTGILDLFEGFTWNLREAAFASEAKAHPDIVVILLDQYSLDWASEENGLSWPWPREAYKIITDFCAKAKAKALGFDVIFTESSIYGVDEDKNFGKSLSEFGRAVGVVTLSNGSEKNTVWPTYFPGSRVIVEGAEEWLSTHLASSLSFKKGSFPIEEIAPGFLYLSNVQETADTDGIYRSALFVSFFDGNAVPSMSLAMYLAGEKTAPRIRISERELLIGDKRFPITAEGEGLLRFRGKSGTHKTFNAAAVIRSAMQVEAGDVPDIDPSMLEGKYVFFGFSAPGLLDLRPTPLDPIYAGVEIHATMLDNLLSGDFISEIPLVFSLLLIIAVVLLCAFFALYASTALRTVFVYSIAMILPFASGFLAFMAGFNMPIIVTEFAVILTIVSAGVINYTTEGKQKRFIKGAFSQYLSPSVIEQIIADPEKLKLGGERRELSMFFSDIQGFTTISERLPPEELTSVLNEYLSAMTDIIMEESGTVDKYEGDAIIAFWNAPLDLQDHAVRAVRAALRCQEKLSRMRENLKQKTGTDLYMRIGLNTGNAVVGNMGSRNRFDYTMLGDSVNLAARLEGINKQFFTYTMVSGATKDKAGDKFAYRELSRVAVVGRKEPVTVYEPMFHEEYNRKKDIVSVFENGLSEYYNRNFEQAIRLFKTVADKDRPAQAYISKCEELIKDPPETWNGVWVMTSK